jgi:hypothetical protein
MDKDLTTRLDKILRKLVILRDYAYEASYQNQFHGFELKPCVSEDEILRFEERHEVTLPEEYRAFLLRVSNGGVGPHFGLIPFQRCLNHIHGAPDYSLKRPFPSWQWETWNKLTTESHYVEFKNRFPDVPFPLDGTIFLATAGCTLNLILVVSGPARGTVWLEDIGGDRGVTPALQDDQAKTVSFLDWYERWLNQSLKSFGH